MGRKSMSPSTRGRAALSLAQLLEQPLVFKVTKSPRSTSSQLSSLRVSSVRESPVYSMSGKAQLCVPTPVMSPVIRQELTVVLPQKRNGSILGRNVSWERPAKRISWAKPVSQLVEVDTWEAIKDAWHRPVHNRKPLLKQFESKESLAFISNLILNEPGKILRRDSKGPGSKDHQFLNWVERYGN